MARLTCKIGGGESYIQVWAPCLWLSVFS